MKFNSNTVLDFLNLLTGFLSIVVIGVSAWLATKTPSDCLSFLHWPFIVVGLLIFCVSVLGFLASFRRKKLLLGIYLILIVPIILLFAAFTIFALVVTAQSGDGQAVPGAKFREYKTTDFSKWLQSRVNEPNWDNIRQCLRRGHLCSDLNPRYPTLLQFYAANLSPTQVGCCKPPSDCGFTFVNPTTWIISNMQGPPAPNADCSLWSNDPSKLCFECDSCRAGEMKAVRQHWLNVATVTLMVLMLFIALFCLACVVLMGVKHNTIPDTPPVKNPWI